MLEGIGIQAITLHPRTSKQRFTGNSNWELIKELKENVSIPVIGNGDIDSPEKAKIMKNEFGLDGAMIGRSSIGNPWIFNEIKHYLLSGNHLDKPSMKERVDCCKQHLEHSIEWKGEFLGIAEMKRHYSNYFKGIPDFKTYRIKMVTSDNKEEIFQTLDEVARKFKNYCF